MKSLSEHTHAGYCWLFVFMFFILIIMDDATENANAFYLNVLKSKLARAEEQLMIADTMDSQVLWGNRCDQLEAAIADALAAPLE